MLYSSIVTPTNPVAAEGQQQDVSQLQEKLAGQAVIGQKFGTFTGVFTPTLLTILGVIMYLRLGWVVGNAGFPGGWLIILIACTITTCTGLAMSPATTNIRIGAGGAFSIISQSLGLEAGGSVGITHYLSQSLAVAMYIFGFREGWMWIFPHHNALAVDMITFLALFALAYVAVFFPAVTGIVAGANMSGDLKDPRRSIPIGTMTAIAVSSFVYLVLAYWLARTATPQELVSNYTIMIDRAAWRPVVLAGLLGATFSSGLASLAGAPRILFAWGDHRILPQGAWFAQQSAKGEPRNATWIAGGIILLALLIRDLNAIAPLISLFFLIPYGMIEESRASCAFLLASGEESSLA